MLIKFAQMKEEPLWAVSFTDKEYEAVQSEKINMLTKISIVFTNINMAICRLDYMIHGMRPFGL